MSKLILDVPGIGRATSNLLANKGIKTLEDLATQTVERLSKVKGFQVVRARKVIEDAQTLLKTSEKIVKTNHGNEEEKSASETSGVPKKPKKIKAKESRADKPKTKKKEKKKKKNKSKSSKKKSGKKQPQSKSAKSKKSSSKKKKKK